MDGLAPPPISSSSSSILLPPVYFTGDFFPPLFSSFSRWESRSGAEELEESPPFFGTEEFARIFPLDSPEDAMIAKFRSQRYFFSFSFLSVIFALFFLSASDRLSRCPTVTQGRTEAATLGQMRQHKRREKGKERKK